MSIFRDTTKHAIAEIICENAEAGRFGIAMTEHDLDIACNSIVDLFEMTLALRKRTAIDTTKEAVSAPTHTLSNTSFELNRKRRVPLSDSEVNRLKYTR